MLLGKTDLSSPILDYLQCFQKCSKETYAVTILRIIN